MRNLLLIKAAPTISTPDLTAEEREELVAVGDPLSLDELTLIFNILFAAEFSIKSSGDPRIAMELVLIKMTRTASVESIAEVIEKLSRLEKGAAGEPPADASNRSFEFQPKTTPATPPLGDRGEPAEKGRVAGGVEKIEGAGESDIEGFVSYLSGRDPVIHSYLVYAVSIRIEGDKVVIELPKRYIHLVSGKDKIEKIQNEFREYFKRHLTVSLVGVDGQFAEPRDEEPSKVSEGGDTYTQIIESRTTKNVKKVFSDATVEGYTPRKK